MRKQDKKQAARLNKWQERFESARNDYSAEMAKMDRREEMYLGAKRIYTPDGGLAEQSAAHVRNIVAELIESQVSSTLPQPKVTAVRERDERLAQQIEDMLRNELDRLPFETMNDQQERTCPIQGGSLYLVEWDSTEVSADGLGDLTVTGLHPKNVVPQHGVTSSIEDMDYIFIVIPQTKRYIESRYDVSVEDESESNPEVRGSGSVSVADDIVDQVVAYYRNDEGGIGLFSWVNDVILEDMEDYQTRVLSVCVKCDMPGDGKRCAYCDSERFRKQEQNEEQLTDDIVRSDGSVIPAVSPALDEMGMPVLEETVLDWYTGEAGLEEVMEPTRIPYYKPDVYPVVLRRNVSVFGKFLGDSDVDKIADQQNNTNKFSTKIGKKLLAGGSVVTMPQGVDIKNTDEELKIVVLQNAAQVQMIQSIPLQPNVGNDLTYLQQLYEEARQVLGITDSFQGRRDTTATSGKAKEFAAAQTAGRLESKRIMKEAAFAQLFEIMFKFKLAYTDEPRSVVSTDHNGGRRYGTFNKWDFLEQDAAGDWAWNDRFYFSCDTSATLAGNREAMWQETRQNYQQGAYGDPTSPETLALFWSRMEQLHYPGAGDTKTYFEQMLQRVQEQAAMQQMAPPGNGLPGENTAGTPAGMEMMQHVVPNL